MRPGWALYASALIAIWQTLFSFNISQDFDILSKVMRKRGIFTVVVLSTGDQRAVDICLRLLTTNPRFTQSSEISSAGATTGTCRITAFIDF
jgi:hypothetical protein